MFPRVLKVIADPDASPCSLSLSRRSARLSHMYISLDRKNCSYKYINYFAMDNNQGCDYQ